MFISMHLSAWWAVIASVHLMLNVNPCYFTELFKHAFEKKRSHVER